MRSLHLFMLSTLLGLSSGTFLAGCCPHKYIKMARPPTLPNDLPKQVWFRTRTETFNALYAFALRNGRIWWKRQHLKTGQRSTTWKLLGKTGLPEGCGIVRFPLPRKLVAISADGIHLQALSSEGVFYRAVNIRENIANGVTWNDAWGWPAGGGPGLRIGTGDPKRWDVSDSHVFHLKHYEDGNGRRHSIGFGVAHLYVLGQQGKRIYYNDWWLPADWSREVCGPCRGTYKAINISTSGSTIMLINRFGEIYTKMADFDISGENPLLTYTFEQTNPPGHVRKLPLPDWRRHPLPGNSKITSRITIFQDGTGNAARDMRVEGEQNGISGYFRKRIHQTTWSFVATKHKRTLPFLSSRPASQALCTLPPGTTYKGTLRKQGLTKSLVLEIKRFSMVCSPAEARIIWKGKALSHKGKDIVLPFHHVHTLVTKRRPRAFWKRGIPAAIRAALLIPATVTTSSSLSVADRAWLQRFFGKARVINLTGTAQTSLITLRELSFLDWFQAPMSEKGWTSRYRLSVHKPF
jgi:hypothetical protein